MKTLVVVAVVFAVGTAVAQEPAGLMNLTPVEAQSCLAVTVPVAADQAVVGVRWYNNDGSVPFERIWVEAGWSDQAPSGLGTVVVGTDVQGLTLGWSQWGFAQSVASTSGELHLVFQLPPFAESQNEGLGGGPGMGYVEGEGAGWLTADGAMWVQLASSCQLMCEAVYGPRTQETLILAPVQARVELKVGQPVAMDQDVVQPRTEMASPYPNPFNPQVNLKFTLARAQRARVSIYDVMGRLVCEVWDRETSAGPHVVAWDGTGRTGARQASGVYLVRLVSPDLVDVRRVLLMK
jgi:hypothetical protein